jgi:putative ABC transport system permease protein
MRLIPLRYNLRNLKARWPTTLLTVAVAAIVVACTSVLFGLVDGLLHTQSLSSDPNDLIIMRSGSDNETTSSIPRATPLELANFDEIESGPRDPAQKDVGLPVLGTEDKLFATELLSIPVMERSDGSRVNLTIRGTSAASPYLRHDFRIVAGRYFVPGQGQCVVPLSLAKRFKGAQLGGVIYVSEREKYNVVGLFTSGGSSAESEVWTGVEDVARNTNNDAVISSMQVRASSAAARDRLIEKIEADKRFNLKVMPEARYFENQRSTWIFLSLVGTVIAVLLTIGALFAAANTMFAAVKSRTREIGTMRAIGFSRRSILLSFLLEAVCICLAGGVLGGLLSLLFSNWSFGISDFDSFSERVIQIRFGLLPLLIATAMTLSMGIFGGLFPALRAVRLDVIKSLREL